LAVTTIGLSICTLCVSNLLLNIRWLVESRDASTRHECKGCNLTDLVDMNIMSLSAKEMFWASKWFAQHGRAIQ
jgi:hypothetical protein